MTKQMMGGNGEDATNNKTVLNLYICKCEHFDC